MTGLAPGPYGEQSSSSSLLARYGHATAEDFDGDDQADLSLDNALLDDDPLDEGNGKAPYILSDCLT
jgi:hypothetical protein